MALPIFDVPCSTKNATVSKGGNINTKTAIGEKGRLHLILAAALLPATSFGQAWLPDKGGSTPP